MARIVWLSYLCCSYMVLPAVFAIRFRRLPYAYAPRRVDVYTTVDFLYAGVLGIYTAALVFGADPHPVSTPAGVAIITAGFAFQVWAVAAMGPNWRFGQDPGDGGVRHISAGPFRFVRHPIYLSLLIISVGQALLAGLDWRAYLLVAATLLHYGVQGRAETRHWTARHVAPDERGASTPDPRPPGGR